VNWQREDRETGCALCRGDNQAMRPSNAANSQKSEGEGEGEGMGGPGGPRGGGGGGEDDEDEDIDIEAVWDELQKNDD